MADCAGGILYNKMVQELQNAGGTRLNFQFDESQGTGGIADFPNLSIRIGPNSSASTLGHEIFHYYQAFDDPASFGSHQLNREVEAHVMSYAYEDRNNATLPAIPNSVEQLCHDLSQFMDANGNFTDNSLGMQAEYISKYEDIRDALRDMNDGKTPYTTMGWQNESLSDAFELLREISENC